MIEVKDVKINYGGFEAVKGVSFTVQDGEFFTLLGPSGCGKTTTLRSIAGFEKVSSGKIILNGKDIAPLAPEERDIGFVFQNYALFPSMTVHDNIAFGLKIRHVKKNEAEDRIREMARMIGITEHLNKKISQISGGQQQRVAIARALITKPCLLLMDEPLSNLDAKLRVQLRNELKKMQKEFGITSIYVTHDQEEALTLSDRIAVFNKGYIEQIGTPNEIYNHSATEFVCNFIGDINRLGDEMVAEINARGAGLDPAWHHYIRLERLHINKKDDGKHFMFEGKVTASEYYGLYIKYTVESFGQTLRVIEKNDGTNPFVEGEVVGLSFNVRNIMSYEPKGEEDA